MNQIVLLHGLHASPAQLTPLAQHLRLRGHQAVALDFQTSRGLDISISQARGQLNAAFPRGEVVVVGFSFGALVGRGIAARLGERCRLLVQIAPPNRGAAWAQRFAVTAAVLYGVRDVRPGSHALERLPVPGCPIAVIAGTVKYAFSAPITWPIALANAALRLDEPGDGTVTVAETQLPHGAELDRVLMPYAHDHLPTVPAMHEQVANVIAHGRFRR